MALTKVSTDGVKDDAITSGKIPANAVGASELADNAVDTNAIASNAVTAGQTSGVMTTINNNADNRVITGSGSANTLNGEANLTFDGGNLISKGDNGISIEASSTSTAGRLTIIGVNASDQVSAISRIQSVSTGSNTAATATTFSNRNASNVVNEHMRITSTGNVGIGTTSPASPLHLHESSSGSIEGLKITNSGTGSGLTDGLSIGLQSDEDVFIHNYENTAIHFGTNDTTRVSILAGGGLTFNGDTATANALDDYEEGEVTITTTASNGNAITVDSSYNKLTYTKIGNVVHVWGYVYFSSNSDADGYVSINSLPFTVKNAHGASAHMRALNTAYFNRNTAYLPDGAGTYNVQVYANENNTWIRVYDLNASGRRVDTCAKFLGTGSVININFSYLAA